MVKTTDDCKIFLVQFITNIWATDDQQTGIEALIDASIPKNWKREYKRSPKHEESHSENRQDELMVRPTNHPIVV
jgi:uncharacterized membrane-anchored protein